MEGEKRAMREEWREAQRKEWEKRRVLQSSKPAELLLCEVLGVGRDYCQVSADACKQTLGRI